MELRHFGNIALLVLMAVAALFFFPAAHGGYSATHGPITALRASAFRALLSFLMASAAAALVAFSLALVAAGRRCPETHAAVLLCASDNPAPLRC